MKVSTNIASMAAIRALGTTQKALSRALERLATGKRINRAGDDAAGLAIGTGLDAQRRGTLQAIRNMNDAQGFLNTAEGAIAEQTNILQRMRELAMQSANGTLASSDRSYLSSEFSKLLNEFDRIANSTDFNGSLLLNGNFSTINLQVGTKAGDIVGVNLQSTQSSKVFIRTGGSGQFTAKQSISQSESYSVKLNDFNGDGIFDILSVSQEYFGNNSIVIAQGNGDGTFATKSSISYGGTILGEVTVGDFNNDKKMDFVVARTSGQLDIYLGNGNGTFAASTTLSGGTSASYPSDVYSGDINGDGIVDLVTTDGANDQILTYISKGNGTFQSAITSTVGDQPAGVTLADFNADGKLDLVSGNITDQSVSVALGNGDGTFTAVSTISSAFARQVKAGDVNNDGIQDLVVSNFNAGYFSVLLGKGNGTFQAARTYDAPGATGTIELADYDGDGNLDAFVPGEGAWTNNLVIFRGAGDGTFSRATTITVDNAQFLEHLALGDTNGDGILDMVTGNWANGHAFTSWIQGSQTYSSSLQLNISTQAKAQNSLSIIDTGLQALASRRAAIGATQSRLNSSINVSQTLSENLAAAESNIMDTDVASETAELTRQQILQQAGVSVLGQANSQMQIVLQLLNSFNRS